MSIKNFPNQNIACEGQTEGCCGIFLYAVLISNFEKTELRPEQKRLYAKICADVIIGLINEGRKMAKGEKTDSTLAYFIML